MLTSRNKSIQCDSATLGSLKLYTLHVHIFKWDYVRFHRKSSFIKLFETSVNNRRSSEIQGTALGKSLRAWTCIHMSIPGSVARSSHAFVGGTVSTWGRRRIPVNKRQKRHQKCRSNTHCSRGTCRSDSRFSQLVV